MGLSDWITWAFRPADSPHRFASFVLARQASRDLGVEITTAEFEAAMPFVVHHRNSRGSAYYLAADTAAKRSYDFHRHVLAEPITHPLNEDQRAPFEALPLDDQAAVLAWIKASLVPIRRTRTVAQLRYPCAIVTGQNLRNDEMRGARGGGYRANRAMAVPLLSEQRRDCAISYRTTRATSSSRGRSPARIW